MTESKDYETSNIKELRYAKTNKRKIFTQRIQYIFTQREN